MLKFQWRGGHNKDSDMSEAGGAGDMRELKRRLQEEGVDPGASDDQKLGHLWQIYVKTEASLKGSLASIEELRQQQAEEMREVENYVEHIRSLSDEREALTLEFEAENEQLKADIVRLTNALDGYKSDEIKEMLLQQSLDEIADGTTSEQIAYLLVERARLMDELEAVETRATIDTPDGPLTGPELLELLEQERQEFEEELGQQRESLRGVKETMRRGHEEEITTMMTENEKLQDMLDEAKQQTSQLERAVSSLKEQLSKQEVTITERSSTQMDVETERAARESAEFEVRQLQCHVQELKADNQTLVESARVNHDELTQFRHDREAVVEIRVNHERTLREKEELIVSLQESNVKLESDIRKLELQLQLAEDEAEDLRQQTSGLIPSGDDLQSRLKNEIEDLKTQNTKLKTELASRPPEEETKKISSSSLHEDNRMEELRADQEKEINSLKTKIRSLENKVSSLEGDLATSQREVWSQQTDFKKRLARLKAESSHEQEERTIDLRHRRHSDGRIIPYRSEPGGRDQPPDPTDLTARDHKFREANDKLREVNERLQAEKDELFNLLETQRQQNSSLRQEMGVNMERISALEKAAYQTQVEKEDLNAKLSTALESVTQRETQIHTTKVLERRESEERLTEAYVTVDELKQEVQGLNADLARSHVHLQQAESRIHAEKTEYEDEAQELRTEVDRLHTKHKGELQSISERLEAAYTDVTDLKRKVNDREEDVTRLRNETNLLQSSETKLKIKLDAEQQKRVALELSNSSLGEQNDKAWSQVKELSIKVSTLEATNDNLRQELDRKTTNFRETETHLTRRVTEQTHTVDTITRRAESAETKLYDLQRDLEAALTQLQTAEEQLRESATLRSELLTKRDEICRLRDQLQDEKLLKTQASQGTEELTSQMALLREKERAAVVRSNDLQHMLLDVEAKLDAMKDQTQNTANIRMQAEAGKKGLLEQVTKMQRELESLQTELSAATERYEIQVQKYNDRKLRTKTKLQKARELFHAERTKCREEVEELTATLRAVQASSTRDKEFKEQLEDTYKKLLVEKRDLLSQVAEQEEIVHDQNRSLSVLQVRTRYLEEENQNLQSRIDSLSRQKGNLDKLIKEYQLERHKEAIGAMSVDVDALMSPRINNNLATHVTSLTNQGLVPVTCPSPLVEALVSPRGQSPNGNSEHYISRPGSSLYGGMVSMSSQDPDSDGVEL